jgi:hypothetical protein
LKDVKGRLFERKNNYFIKLLNNPNILKKKDIMENLFDQFTFKLNKDLIGYLYNPMNLPDASMGHSMYFDSSMSNGSPSATDQQHHYQNDFNNLSENTHNNITDNNYTSGENVDNNAGASCNANGDHEIKDLSKMSTMEDYSDYEDEVDGHVPCYMANQQESGISPIDSTTAEILPSSSPTGTESTMGSIFKSKIFI